MLGWIVIELKVMLDDNATICIPSLMEMGNMLTSGLVSTYSSPYGYFRICI